jgi:hypothetical protein
VHKPLRPRSDAARLSPDIAGYTSRAVINGKTHVASAFQFNTVKNRVPALGTLFK